MRPFDRVRCLAPLLCLVLGCSDHPPARSPASETPVDTPAPTRSLEAVRAQHDRELEAIPGVIGIGETLSNGKPAIQIYVNKLTPELSAKIPSTIEGYPVVIEQTGEIKPL